MIPVSRQPLFEVLFTAYTTHKLRKHFNSVVLRGTEYIETLDQSLPIIVYGNHSSWWDGLIEYYLSRRVLRLEPYLMMDEEQMSKYRFFRWIGAFSVNRTVPREAAVSLRYAMNVFAKPQRVLWIYPQGVMRPNESRPLNFYPGIGRIAKGVGKVQLVPIAHRYEFIKEQRPDAFISFGAPQLVERVEDHESLTRDLERRLILLLEELKQIIAEERFDGFATLLRGRTSTNVAYDRWRGFPGEN